MINIQETIKVYIDYCKKVKCLNKTMVKFLESSMKYIAKKQKTQDLEVACYYFCKFNGCTIEPDTCKRHCKDYINFKYYLQNDRNNKKEKKE